LRRASRELLVDGVEVIVKSAAAIACRRAFSGDARRFVASSG
jgi:hypothetical protein